MPFFSYCRRTNPTQTVTILAIGLYYAGLVRASETPDQWVNGALPQPGTTLKDKIQCYALPFGGIGFTSHLLTYYTICMLIAKRSPWLLKKNKHWKLDVFLGIAGLLWTTTSSIFTIVRCRGTWQLVILGVWKMVLSLDLGLVSTHVALDLRREVLGMGTRNPDDDSQYLPSRAQWCSTYMLACLIGYVSIFDIVHQTWHLTPVKGFTAGLIGFICLLGIIILIYFEDFEKRSIIQNPGIWVAFAFYSLGALYSDWILAAITGNWAGVPDGNNAVLFWGYFVAKRFSFFSL